MAMKMTNDDIFWRGLLWRAVDPDLLAEWQQKRRDRGYMFCPAEPRWADTIDKNWLMTPWGEGGLMLSDGDATLMVELPCDNSCPAEMRARFWRLEWTGVDPQS